MILPENPVIATIRNNLGEDREIFLVGGSVRDILLSRDIKDYDFVMEGDIYSLARVAANSLGSKLSLNKRLMTASFHSPWGSVDFASARKEYYKYPGALPTVSPAHIYEDVTRRDFTINTLLLPLSNLGWGQAKDLLGGIKDLEQGLIRFLHQNSFRDDPTRIIRALCFKNRFKFRLEQETQSCLQRDWAFLSRISPARRLKQWSLICEEDNLSGVIEDIRELGGWESFFGPIAHDSGLINNISELKKNEETKKLRFWYLALLTLLIASPRSLDGLALYWGFSKRDRESLGRTIQLLDDADLNSQNRRGVFRILKALPLESAYYIYKFILKWDLSWRDFSINLKEFSLPVKGGDLLKLGIEPGQYLGEILGYLEKKYLEGAFTTREEGIRLAKTKIKEEG